MEIKFNHLIDSFLENQVGITDNFLEASLIVGLRTNLNSLFDHEQLINAGTGNALLSVQNKQMRGDQIHWLDQKHNNTFENDFLHVIDQFILFLNETCYTGINSYEFHYTLYTAGSFYKRHLDQFHSNKDRKYSMIIYLNDCWKTEDAGELCIYHQHHIQRIKPLSGKCVFFKSSELEHEVLLTNSPRLSITGWLKSI